MLTTFTDAWSSTSSLGGNFGDVIGSERIEHFKLQDEMSRWLFNFHHHFYDDECNGEMSMNMIVRMKVFQLKCKKENQCLLRRQSLILNEKSSYSPHSAQDLAFIQGTRSRYLSMMFAMMMNTNGND